MSGVDSQHCGHPSIGPIVLGDPGPSACSYHVKAVKQPGAGVNVVVRAIVVEGLITPLIVNVLAT